MAWYNFFTPKVEAEEKLNPVQHYDIGHEPSREVHAHTWYYENLEIVNRGVNMVINDAAAIPTLVGQATKHPGVVSGIRQSCHRLHSRRKYFHILGRGILVSHSRQ
jgi:hypothetical protein